MKPTRYTITTRAGDVDYYYAGRDAKTNKLNWIARYDLAAWDVSKRTVEENFRIISNFLMEYSQTETMSDFETECLVNIRICTEKEAIKANRDKVPI